MTRPITARVITQSGEKSTQINVARPKWDDVYNGYPKASNGDDLDTESVFISILGQNYDRKIFTNACATRVSLGLIAGGITIDKNFEIKSGSNKGKGFIASARGLKDWLSQENIWGKADEIIKGPSTLAEVSQIINGRNGVYFIIGGFGGGISGHATLWIGANNDVIGSHNYIHYGGDIYFWQLK